MTSTADLFHSIQKSPAGLTLAELLARHSDIARRTAQRWVSNLIDDGQIKARGEGRARHYLAVKIAAAVSHPIEADIFPEYIPPSADSRDILAYVGQPLEARKPVGYQSDFLDAYQPNQTWYGKTPENFRNFRPWGWNRG